MQLYNTLSGRKEDFVSLKPGQVGMYVCGPTVYDYDHIGHARTYLAFDLLNRFLQFQENSVTYVQNITDVGHMVGDGEGSSDKVQQKAQETGQTISQVVSQFTESHLKDLESLHIKMPTKTPKASEHIPTIITFIQGLVDKGLAYVTTQGNVYFSVAKDPDYGKLSHRGLAEVITGTRVEAAKDKRSPADFALWKAAPVSIHEMIWDSPWGRGYPGWHIECSAMSREYLGDTFDIHGAAIEHVFPHHENEIAQSESLTGKPMARFWVHAGMLTVGGQKMSKSAHNGVTIQDALKEYSANELRLTFFQTHYRKPFDYTKAALEQGIALRRKLFTAYSSLPSETGQTIFDDIVEALNDDLDTPKALQIWAEHPEKLNQADTQKLFDIFGLVYLPIDQNEAVLKLAEDRATARTRADFLTADNRKSEIMQQGFDVVDTPTVTEYIPR